MAKYKKVPSQTSRGNAWKDDDLELLQKFQFFIIMHRL